jgi:outer membrane lipoprotein-sorting protein
MCVHAEKLVRVKGKEAEDIVRILVDTLSEMESFTLKLKKTRTSEFFEPVKTVSRVVWKKPMYVKWNETDPETKKTESVSLLTPDSYMHYVKVHNTVEILDVSKHKDAKKRFGEYAELIKGGYKAISKKYSFLVYKTEEKKGEPEVRPVKPEKGQADPSGGEKKEDRKDGKKKKKDVIALWRGKCAEFRKTHGRYPSEYRIKFKPRTKEMKKEIIHINFVVHGTLVISKVIVVMADGDVITSEVTELTDINRDIPVSEFVFKPPADAKVTNLLEE